MAHFHMKRTIEAVMLPLAFVPVVSGGLPDTTENQKQELLYLLKEAVDEVLPPKLNSRDQDELFRKARTILYSGMLRTSSGINQLVPEAGLSIYYFINNMLAQGTYYISLDCKFNDFFNEVLPKMSEWAEYSTTNFNAYNQARYALFNLQELGYYQGDQWVLNAAEI